MSETTNEAFIEIDKMSIDQAAGAFVMIAGAIGSLLLVIWQSKCHCKMNLCYIFQCERRPPNEEEMKGLKKQTEKLKDKKDKNTSEGKPIFENEVQYKENQLQKDYLAQKPMQTENSNESIIPKSTSQELDKLM